MSETNPFCARCASLGDTCCVNTAIFLTRGDLGRIAGFAGDDDFHEDRAVDLAALGEVDPLWRRTAAGGRTMRVLRHADEGGGGCLFLRRDGCGLPLAVRPLVCRLYPYEYDMHSIKGVNATLCPYPERDNAPLLLALLEMNRDRAEMWRKQLYEEVLDEFPDHA